MFRSTFIAEQRVSVPPPKRECVSGSGATAAEATAATRVTSVTEAWQQRQQRQKRRSDGNGGSARGGDGGSRSDNNGGVSVLWCMRAGVNGACSSHAVLPPVVNHIGSLPSLAAGSETYSSTSHGKVFGG